MPARSVAPPRAAVALVAACALLAACGGGDGATGPTVASLRVVNATGRPIVRLFYQRCVQPTWGADRLGALAPLAPGTTYGIDSIPSGCYDLRADTDDGRRATRFQQNLRGGDTFEWTLTLPDFVAAPAAP